MPTLSITTNVVLPAGRPVQLCQKLSAAVAKTTGKPEAYVCVSLSHSQAITFGGTDAPAAHGSLVSIGALGPRNAAHCAAISAVLTAELGIPNDRFYLAFQDIAAKDMGWSGATF